MYVYVVITDHAMPIFVKTILPDVIDQRKIRFTCLRDDAILFANSYYEFGWFQLARIPH